MKLKKIGLFAICIMAIFTLTGCGNKNMISKDDFITKDESRVKDTYKDKVKDVIKDLGY